MKYLDIVRSNLATLIEEREAAVADMESATATAVEENRSELTDIETAAHEEARAKVEAIDEQIGTLEERVAELEKLDERQARLAGRPELQIIDRVETSTQTPEDMRRLLPGEKRDKALAMLDARKDEIELNDHAAAKLDRLVRRQDQNLNGAEISERMLITETDDYRSGWQKLVTQTTPVLTPEEARAVSAFQEFRAASSSSASGGYGVPVLIDPSIVNVSQGSLNPLRRISRQETITTNVWKGVSSGGVQWSYDTEASEVSDDMVTLAQPSVTAYTARGFIPYSIEIGQDYPNFASEMSSLLMQGYDELQAQAFCTGAGSTEPFGILTALDATAAVEVTPTTDGQFGGVDINKVWGALPDKYKANATWVMNYDVANEIATFGNSNNLSFVTVDLTGQISTLRQKPVEFASYFPDFTGTTGASNILVVGDFRNYLIVDRAGMDVELVPHLFHTANNRPSGQRGWFAWARHGADSINDFGFRLLQNQ